MNKSGGCTCGNPNCDWCGGWRQPDSVPIDVWMEALKKCDKCEAKDKRIAELEAAAVELRSALQDRWAANSHSELYKANSRVEAAEAALAALLPGGE